MTELRKQINNIVEDHQACLTLAKSMNGNEVYEGTTATAEDIREGKTAYSNGELIEGAMKTEDSGSENSTIETIIPISDYVFDEPNLIEYNTTNIYKIITHINDIVYPAGHGAFSGCEKLTYVKGVDFSKTTTGMSTFRDCKALITCPILLNYANVASWAYCFMGCENLLEAPELDTSTVTSGLSQMFRGCSKIISAPHYDTSNLIVLWGMFQDCTSLVNVPVYATSKLGGSFRAWSGLTDFVKNCPNLSDESLNNILQMCYNATKITSANYTTLANVGLSQSQVERCKTLSNYNKLIAKGWTTGY